MYGNKCVYADENADENGNFELQERRWLSTPFDVLAVKYAATRKTCSVSPELFGRCFWTTMSADKLTSNVDQELEYG